MKILQRSEQRKENTWDLGSLYESVEAWDAARGDIEQRIVKAADFKGALLKDKASFLTAMRWYEETMLLIEQVYSYAFLSWATDASDSDATRMYSLATDVYTRLSTALAFFSVELMEVSDATIASYLADPAFKDYAIFIKKARHLKPYVLSEDEERLLAMQSNAATTAKTVFSDLTNVDFDFGEIDGKPLSQSTFSSFLMSEDRSLRRRAYTQFYGVYDQHKHTLGRLYEGQVKQDLFRSGARGYESARQMALYGDNVPLSVYDSLIASVHEAFPVLHRYYAVRAKALGLTELGHWDAYVPLVKGIKAHTPYEQAVKIIGEALKPLGHEYVQTLTEGLTTERWVDRYENKGKRSGAFSAGCFTGNPYILTNFEEDVINSVFTLIHEGGHSMHSYFSAKNNPFPCYNYTIFEAEVASTFNENLLMKYLMSHTDNRKRRHSL